MSGSQELPGRGNRVIAIGSIDPEPVKVFDPLCFDFTISDIVQPLAEAANKLGLLDFVVVFPPKILGICCGILCQIDQIGGKAFSRVKVVNMDVRVGRS